MNTKNRKKFFAGGLDQRKSQRFPVKEEVRYRVFQTKTAQLVGIGRTVNISSGGILFMTSEPLPTGCLVEISVTWPARLSGYPLQLVVTGPIVRADFDKAAARILRYEFRRASAPR
jgi:hypothetical protein